MRRNSGGARQESRTAMRRTVRMPCSLLADGWSGPQRFDATDVSEHGLWLQTLTPLPIGTQVAVVFLPPDGKESIYVAAEVRRVRTGGRDHAARAGMGIAFVGLRPGDRRALSASLHNLLPQQAPSSLIRTLPGVPVARLQSSAKVDQDEQDEIETLSGWPAPQTSGVPSKRHSMVRFKKEPLKVEDDLHAFGGGLDLIASVFGVRR